MPITLSETPAAFDRRFAKKFPALDFSMADVSYYFKIQDGITFRFQSGLAVKSRLKSGA
jgi:hypothetical protein